MGVAVDREAFFIDNLIKSKVAYKLGDDGILLDNKIYAMDLFCENVHFKTDCFTYYEIAKKAMLVNISDIFAMGSTPKYAMLGISLSPKMTARDILDLQRGFIDICLKFHIKIIGGDTISDNKLNIAITMFGERGKFVIERKNFRANDILFATGNLGSVIKDMKALYRGNPISKHSKFYTPQLKWNFIKDILPFIKGGMDISDGLFYELNRISKMNNVRFIFYKKINRQAFLSGEEYELLFSIAPKDIRRLKLIATKHKIRLLKIAKITQGRQRFYCPPHHK